MPARNKKQSALPSDKRHDNGLIAPGKKVVKDKNPLPHANGHVPGVKPYPLPADPATVEDPSASDPSTPDDHVQPSPPPQDNLSMAKSLKTSLAAASAIRRSSADSQSLAADAAAATATATADLPSTLHANGTSTASKYDPSAPSVDAVTTVIGPHSHWDVLAILLLLLQLPPVLLVLVQASFAFMTFGNTGNSWSMFSISSAPDWFRSHGGNPSAVVSLLADVTFTAIWLLSPVLKDFVLELAPAIVALSLGGGTAAKDSWKHALLCMFTVLVGHVFQEARRRQYCSNLIWMAMSKLSLSHLPFAPLPVQILPNSQRAARSWARIILELHIVTHGFVRVIRRWIDRSAQSSGGRARGDTDPNAATPTPAALGTGDAALEGARNASTDGRPPGQPPSQRDKTVLSSGKKRRKQATLVRSQQPFWAAIATTKIQVSKEIEQSHAERDNFEAEATSINSLGDAKANCLDDRVWITKVDDTEIWFTATMLRDDDTPRDPDNDSGASSRRSSQDAAVIDVHVNGAYWSSVDSHHARGDGAQHDKSEVEGKIFGLTPSTNYLVEFVRLAEGKVIHASSLLTRPVASNGQGSEERHLSAWRGHSANESPAANLSSQAQDALRPSSPTTTLRKSIEAADCKLLDHKNRSNKARKGRQTATRNLKQEVSDLSRNVASCATNERQHQRQLQYRQNIKQAEESAADLADQIANLGEIPASDLKVFETSKSKWTVAARQRDALRKELDASKREAQKKANEAHSENAKVRAKREKAEGRLASLMDRHKSTAEENDAKRNAKTYSEAQHAYKVDHYRNLERNMLRDLQTWEASRQEYDLKTAQLEQQKYYYDAPYHQSMNGHINVPPTPESSNLGLASVSRAPFVNNLAYPMGAPAPPGILGRQSSLRQRTRGRSSSMLSNISGFTDDETPPLIPEHSAAAANDIMRNGSGSPREAGFPSPPKLNPIGAEVSRGSPRQAKR